MFVPSFNDTVLAVLQAKALILASGTLDQDKLCNV